MNKRFLFALGAIFLSGCASHRFEAQNPAASLLPPVSTDVPRTYTLQDDIRRSLSREAFSISRELEARGFKHVMINDAISASAQGDFCKKYPNHLSVQLKYLGNIDAGGQDFFTGLTFGAIPSWHNDHPHSEISFEYYTGCKLTGSRTYIEYERSFAWLPVAIPGFFVSSITELNVGTNVVKDFLGTSEAR